MANTNKAGIKSAPKNIKQCCISAAKASEKQVSAEATKQAAKKLAEESIKTGLSAEEAARGAKEVMAATGGLTGKSALESAMVFSKAPTQAELKAELLLKHGDKLKAKQAEKLVQEEIAKLDKLL